MMDWDRHPDDERPRTEAEEWEYRKGVQPYGCDVCGRMCLRTHKLVAYGTDTIACDDCAGYEWEAYDEQADPLLHP